QRAVRQRRVDAPRAVRRADDARLTTGTCARVAGPARIDERDSGTLPSEVQRGPSAEGAGANHGDAQPGMGTRFRDGRQGGGHRRRQSGSKYFTASRHLRILTSLDEKDDSSIRALRRPARAVLPQERRGQRFRIIEGFPAPVQEGPMQLTLALLLPLLVAAAPPLERPDAGSRAAQQAQTDLDALMARALEHRASAWKTLEQYILNER